MGWKTLAVGQETALCRGVGRKQPGRPHRAAAPPGLCPTARLVRGVEAPSRPIFGATAPPSGLDQERSDVAAPPGRPEPPQGPSDPPSNPTPQIPPPSPPVRPLGLWILRRLLRAALAVFYGIICPVPSKFTPIW